MCRTDLRTLNNYYHWILSSYQSFDMCLYDVDSIQHGNAIGYGIDGYDLCRFIFPKSCFRGRPNPHHEAICSTWRAFFEQSDGTVTFGIISPFATLELLATIEETASGKQLSRLINASSKETRSLVEEIVKGIRSFEEIPRTKKATVDKLAHLAKLVQNARYVIQKGKVFEELALLLNQGKVKLLDPIISNTVSPTALPDLLSYEDKQNLSRGLRYLKYKRQSYDSEYATFYNTLDIYHYVLFENVDPILEPKRIQAYISSSGILSRNSWLLTKYGKFLENLDGIPGDWSARSSDVPNFVTKALQYFNGDIKQVKDFFEESRSLARMLLRDLQEVPEVYSCVYSSRERRQLLESNPEVKVKNEVPHTIRRFHNYYYRILVPEFKGLAFEGDVPHEIDFEALYEWIMDPETRSREFDTIASQVQEQIVSLNLQPMDWTTYIAPLGETSYEILRTFDPNLDK